MDSPYPLARALRADPELRLADSQIRLHASDRELRLCPVAFRQAEDGCNFVIFKTVERNDRCRFFWKASEQAGTGVDEDNDLAECAVTLLQVRADDVAEQQGDLPARKC